MCVYCRRGKPVVAPGPDCQYARILQNALPSRGLRLLHHPNIPEVRGYVVMVGVIEYSMDL